METKRLKLNIPHFEDLWYKKKLLEDPDTMDYNRGYHLSYPGYDNETGCIYHPDEYWDGWFKKYVNNEPGYFYAYLILMKNGDYIGCVNLHPSSYHPEWLDMGIVIEGRHRGKGYSKEGLRLLLEAGFKRCASIARHNGFENDRDSAFRIHKSAGFKEIESSGKYIDLAITREEYLGDMSKRSCKNK